MNTKGTYLRIPFKLNENSEINSSKNESFYLNDCEIRINTNNTHVGYFDIYNIGNYDSDELYTFYLNFRDSIHLLNITKDFWSIKIEDITFDELKGYIFGEKLNSTKNDDVEIIKKGNRYEVIMPPIEMNIKMDVNVEVTEYNSVEEIQNKISIIFPKIKSNFLNKKQKTAINLYADSYYKDDMSRFLIYVTILELLKPKIRRENESKKCCSDLKDKVKEYQEKYADENLQKEFNEIMSSLSHIHERSISYSIKQLSEEYDILLENIDIEEMIGVSYKVRSKFVHEGVIRDEFENCLKFLEDYIPKLLKFVIEKRLDI